MGFLERYYKVMENNFFSICFNFVFDIKKDTKEQKGRPILNKSKGTILVKLISYR